MNEQRYEVGFIGRTSCELTGVGKQTEEVIPTGSLVEVVFVDDISKIDPQGEDKYLHTIILLRRNGAEDKRKISYDGIRYGQLYPEPGVINWSREDSKAAIRQGWDIFIPDDEDHPRFEIQAVLGSEEDSTLNSAFVIGDRFKSDQEAHLFVWHGAVSKGDALCKRALEFLYARSPKEYANIREVALTVKTCTGTL